jgi:hypothetical protein
MEEEVKVAIAAAQAAKKFRLIRLPLVVSESACGSIKSYLRIFDCASFIA